MCRHRTRLHRQTPRKIIARIAQPERTAVLWAYVVLFAVVLPFICWGKYANPAHPHPVAHFVFHLPPMNAAQMPQVPQVPRMPATGGHQAVNGAVATGFDATEIDGTGVSSPALAASVMTTLMQVLLLGWVFNLAERKQRVRLRSAEHPKSYIPRIPTPPPRVSSL